MLRVELEDWSENRAYARYDTYRVGDEKSKYRLSLGSYSGIAGNALNYNNGMFFTTKDQDNDRFRLNCARLHTGAWWYKHCQFANLNGRYAGNKHDHKGIHWRQWKDNLSMKRLSMKIRPT